MQICTYSIFSVPQQKEVAGVWYRDHEGKQFLKIALPADAWSMAATIKTRKGVHRMTMDRWGDSTHKMSAYNNSLSSLQQRPKTNRQDEEGDNGTISNSTSQSGTA